MQIRCNPGSLSGEIHAPPSKSLSQRALAAAFLAKRTSVLYNFSVCDDALAALDLIRKLGADVVPLGNEIHILGGFLPRSQQLNCKESGLAMRMFSPIVALHKKKFTFTGEGSLLKRPVGMIGEALKQFGAEFNSNKGLLPFTIMGPLRGGNATIDGSVSSQLLTGLLMALPCAEENSQIRVTNLKSKPYVSMTIKLLSDFGIHVEHENFEWFRIPGKQQFTSREYTIEGDWSAAAFLLVAGAIHGNIRVRGIEQNSFQADKAILNALKLAGAIVKINTDNVEVEKSELHAFTFDATECPDLFPPISAMAAYCKGTSVISGVERLIHKESNRAQSIHSELLKMGVNIRINNNDMIIDGGSVSGANVNSHNDHRIAMMATVMATGANGMISISDAGCVSKSYPGFFNSMRKLGAIIEEV